MAKQKKSPREMALAAEKKKARESIEAVAKERDFWRVSAIVAAALILVWLWTKIKF